MTLIFCPHEKEIADLLRIGHWPAASPAELRAHAKTCPRCSDLILITQTFRQARAQSSSIAPLDSPGLLWWRAQLRRRNAALETIARPIQRAQLFTFVLAFLVSVALVATQAHHGIQWLANLQQSPSIETLWSIATTPADWNLTLLIPSLVTIAIFTAVALYLAIDKKQTH